MSKMKMRKVSLWSPQRRKSICCLLNHQSPTKQVQKFRLICKKALKVLVVEGFLMLLKEMLQEVPNDHGSLTLDQETGDEGVEGKSGSEVDIAGAKDDGDSTSMDQHFSEPSEMGTDSGLDGQNHNISSNKASAILALTCHEMECKSLVSASIEALHDNEENKSLSHIEDCMFSSWEIDLISEASFSNEFEGSKIAGPQNHKLKEEVVVPGNRLSNDGDINNPTNKMTETSKDIERSTGSFNVDNSDEVADNKTTMSAMTKRKNSISIMIHGTPRKLPLITHDMKENIAVTKRVEMVDVTAVKPMVKRKTLEDLHK